MGIDVYLGNKTTVSGRRYCVMHFFFADEMTDEDIIDRILNRTNFSYIAGRRVYQTNDRAKRFIDKGDYIIEREEWS